MRCFIALDLSAEVINEIKKIQEKLPEFVGKKIGSENLHLTLKFLGEVSEDEVEKIKECLRKIKISKFEMETNIVGVFSEKIIRIVWLHLTNCDALQKEIDNSLKEIFKPEERFMGHLTIARVKNVGSEQSSGLERPSECKHPHSFKISVSNESVAIRKNKKEFLEKLKKIKIPKINFMVENFKLKSSILKLGGPVYEDIKTYNLE